MVQSADAAVQPADRAGRKGQWANKIARRTAVRMASITSMWRLATGTLISYLHSLTDIKALSGIGNLLYPERFTP